LTLIIISIIITLVILFLYCPNNLLFIRGLWTLWGWIFYVFFLWVPVSLVIIFFKSFPENILLYLIGIGFSGWFARMCINTIKLGVSEIEYKREQQAEERARKRKEYERKKISEERRIGESQKLVNNKLRIEQIAMDHVKSFEIQNQRKPVDVSSENLGYDIKSTDCNTTRFIEVKGRGYEGDVLLTENEWKKAGELGNTYFLYVILNCITNIPTLYIIQNPSKLTTKYIDLEKKHIVSYETILNYKSLS
jgi:hypothetical protein